MTQIYFDHPLEERTWYSENKTTKKVIDYILMERYIQQFVQGCSVKSQIDFGSDHRLLLTEMHTPSTRRARKFLNNKAYTNPDPKSLAIKEVKQVFLQKVKDELLHKNKVVKPCKKNPQSNS